MAPTVAAGLNFGMRQTAPRPWLSPVSSQCHVAGREKLREDAQFRVAENYLLSGLGRHAPDDDVILAIRSIFALSVQLGDKSCLMGEAPCGVDATAFGALAGILTPYFVSKLRTQVEKFDNLTAYVDRMMGQYYPEFSWMPVREREAA